jgi:preprotein translocase subunit SecG
MIIVTGLLTVLLVLVCLLLILLVLVQLPKKEAGAGLAFGGAATDALFGAGSGNVLTKVTKYATISFFVLTLVVAMLQSKKSGTSAEALEKAIATQNASRPSNPGTAMTTPPAASNFLSTTAAALTNAPATITTNAPGN